MCIPRSGYLAHFFTLYCHIDALNKNETLVIITKRANLAAMAQCWRALCQRVWEGTGPETPTSIFFALSFLSTQWWRDWKMKLLISQHRKIGPGCAWSSSFALSPWILQCRQQTSISSAVCCAQSINEKWKNHEIAL